MSKQLNRSRVVSLPATCALTEMTTPWSAWSWMFSSHSSCLTTKVKGPAVKLVFCAACIMSGCPFVARLGIQPVAAYFTPDLDQRQEGEIAERQSPCAVGVNSKSSRGARSKNSLCALCGKGQRTGVGWALVYQFLQPPTQTVPGNAAPRRATDFSCP